jgi:hypothetical protein
MEKPPAPCALAPCVYLKKWLVRRYLIESLLFNQQVIR